MTEHNPRAFIGANNPPAYDQSVVEQLNEKAASFLDVAAEWISKGELNTENDAQLLNDFITGVKKNKTEAETARKAAKKPHDDAGKAVQAAFKPISEKLDAAVSKVSPLLTAFLQKKEVKRQAEIARQRQEAEAARLEAERKAAQAAARNDISGEIDAQAAQHAADTLAKEAAAAAKSKGASISSATGGGRTASLRTTYSAEVDNVRAVFMRYQSHPALIECMCALANAEIRSKGFDPKSMTIPGVKIVATQKAV